MSLSKYGGGISVYKTVTTIVGITGTKAEFDAACTDGDFLYVGDAIANVVEDLTPQLGGTLDANTFSIDMGVNTITDTKVGQWDTAYGWGDHASAGYLTSFTETDPTVGAHIKAILAGDITNWNTAYGWGNHATAGYLTDIVQDLTPSLGGDLDCDTNDIIDIGSIGVGVSVPTYPLHVETSSAAPAILKTTSGFYSHLYLPNFYSGGDTTVGISSLGSGLYLRADGATPLYARGTWVELATPLFITESATATTDLTGRGQIWVKDTTPCELWYTDDAGTDYSLMDSVKNSDFTAKGQLLVATGSGAKTALAVGTDTHVLTADSTTASGVKWAAASGGSTVGYCLQGFANSHSPSDGTTYYLGMWSTTPGTTSNQRVLVVPKTGTITAATVWSYASSLAGSNEAWTMYVRINHTTDVSIATVSSTGPARTWSNFGLSQAVTAGDEINIKFTAPTWATNPTAVTYNFAIYIE